jgi:hypothetical protein
MGFTGLEEACFSELQPELTMDGKTVWEGRRSSQALDLESRPEQMPDSPTDPNQHENKQHRNRADDQLELRVPVFIRWG